MKRVCLTMVAALALGAAGCEKKPNDTGTGSTGSTKSTGASDNGSGSVGSTKPAPTTDATQDSPLGAMRLFIDRMGAGEFGQALAYVDPSCELHAEMAGIVESLEKLESSDAPKSADAGDAVRASFAPPYRGAEATLVSDEADRAMVELKRIGFPPVDVQMSKGTDGKWFVVGDNQLFAPAFGGAKPPAPAPPPPAG